MFILRPYFLKCKFEYLFFQKVGHTIIRRLKNQKIELYTSTRQETYPSSNSTIKDFFWEDIHILHPTHRSFFYFALSSMDSVFFTTNQVKSFSPLSYKINFFLLQYRGRLYLQNVHISIPRPPVCSFSAQSLADSGEFFQGIFDPPEKRHAS